MRWESHTVNENMSCVFGEYYAIWRRSLFFLSRSLLESCAAVCRQEFTSERMNCTENPREKWQGSERLALSRVNTECAQSSLAVCKCRLNWSMNSFPNKNRMKSQTRLTDRRRLASAALEFAVLLNKHIARKVRVSLARRDALQKS